MSRAEYPGNEGCPQRDSAEHEEYAGARSADRRETEEADSADLLERILDRDNLSRAYKRVKANKGAPGVDGMTVKDALPWLREHREENFTQLISLIATLLGRKYKDGDGPTVPKRYVLGTAHLIPAYGIKCPLRTQIFPVQHLTMHL